MAEINTNKVAYIAVIGSGYWGENLVRNFHQLGVLKLICDKNENIVNQFKKQYPDVETCLDLEDVFCHEDIKAVVIATPAETHFAVAQKALSAGRHVFVEKPLALTETKGRQLVKLAEQNELILMVGHILQYHPAVIKLKDLINSGELGKIQYLYSNRLNIGKIRHEENILWSFAPHDISVILMLLGEMPEAVYATGGSYLQRQIPDTTLTTMDFPSGVKAHIFVSWLHPYKEQKLVVVGDKKMAVFDDVSEEKLLLYPHKIDWLDRIPVASKEQAEVVPVTMEEPLKAECRHFLECLENKQQPRTDGQEGLRVLKILQASQASLDDNGSNVYIGSHLKEELESRRVISSAPSSGYDAVAKNCLVHESAYLDTGIEIGESTKIWHFSHILSGSRIGKNCNIGQNVVIGPDVIIGNGCKIQNNVSIYKGVTLEDHVFCGPSMVFTNVYNPRSEIPRMDEVRQTSVKHGVTIGANATIICGITIGRYAFIGAGAVVTGDVPDYALMVGNPARQIGWACRCGERLSEQLECVSCGSKFEMKEQQIREKGMVS
ncbi:MAG: Gfo/Idh/MocA family oxidoreductase [Deltaproteobacteria bacterium]|nr:Gfo/Idh/MocA family oxidoreductase [Deltaproteobacteria bacterium]